MVPAFQLLNFLKLDTAPGCQARSQQILHGQLLSPPGSYSEVHGPLGTRGEPPSVSDMGDLYFGRKSHNFHQILQGVSDFSRERTVDLNLKNQTQTKH